MKHRRPVGEDSIFDKPASYRASVSSSDSTFFSKNSEGHNSFRYQPMSSFSIPSSHGPVNEDGNMISVSSFTIYKKFVLMAV